MYAKVDIFFGISTIEREENKGASKEGEEAYQIGRKKHNWSHWMQIYFKQMMIKVGEVDAKRFMHLTVIQKIGVRTIANSQQNI